ncbi:MAG: T9SS type A sorting domain-containing protein, partial [Bacteroidota bacterium]
GQWFEYSVDFSDQALASHKKIAIFFNGGALPLPGDVYYIDDIMLVENPLTVIENFETGTAFLPWEPLDGISLLHGTFAVADNPAAGGVNNSPKVGKYTKGSATFATLVAVAPGVFNISAKPQFNLDVLAPAGTTNGTVIMQLESTGQLVEVTRDLETPGEWETMSFDFSEWQGDPDVWVGMRLLFNPGVSQQGAMFFFDNLTQSASTVDPCEGVVAIPNIVDDFECQRNYEYGAGSDRITVVGNPEQTVVNQSTLVGLYKDVAGQEWEALCANFPDGIDLSVFNQLAITVRAPENLTAPIPLLFKLEGGSSPASEIWKEITTPGEWEKITADFSSQVGMDHKRACFFFNGGVAPTAEDEYYIDNIRFEHAPFTGCIMSFEDPAFSSLEWKYFPNGTDGPFELADNPAPGGINTSAKVGKATENASSGQPWQGMYTDLPSFIDLSVTKLVKMKVYAPAVASITMKLENPVNPAHPAQSGDNTVANTKMNEWEELTWDFNNSPNPLPDDGQYQRVTLIFDITTLPTSDRVWYFDDLSLVGGTCATNGIFETPEVAALSISPNPANQTLRVANMENVSSLSVFNLFGERVASVYVGSEAQVEFDVTNLAQGVYVLASYDRDGILKGNARFVKQ